MEFKAFSKKQSLAAGWWSRRETSGYDAIICDGAVRSGKTTAMSLGFVSWAMTTFHRQSFAICGRTVTALKRNVVKPLVEMLGDLGFTCIETIYRFGYRLRAQAV